jgi:hypothetical protein
MRLFFLTYKATGTSQAERKIYKGQRIIYKTLYCCLRATRTPVQKTYDVGNPRPDFGLVHKYGGVKPVNGIPTLFL